MTLADWEIAQELQRARLRVDPMPDLATALQPASLELTLDRHFQVLTPHRMTRATYLDPADDSSELFAPVTIDPDGVFVLGPGQCALGTTYEHVALPPDLVGRVEGKSSIARLFLLVHTTAGFIDPGFDGQVTLELVNLTSLPIRLHAGMRIGQLALDRLAGPADRVYGEASVRSHYQGQVGPTPSQSWRGFTAGLPAELRSAS